MITQLTLFTPPAAPDTAALRARTARELANWQQALNTMDYPPPLAATLRALIAAAEQQQAALDDDERQVAA